MIVNTTGEVINGYRATVIMGDLSATYPTAPTSYIGTYGQWDSIDAGYAFEDYDEIEVVCIRQGTPSATSPDCYEFIKVPVYMIQNAPSGYGAKINHQADATAYVTFALRASDNSFYLDNFNYLAPIALVGIKY